MNRLAKIVDYLPDIVRPGMDRAAEEWYERTRQMQQETSQRITAIEERLKQASMNGELKWFLCPEPAHEVLVDDDGIPADEL
jgi:phosphoenolpyruvate synthase/pyruvate phosphate dikinase